MQALLLDIRPGDPLFDLYLRFIFLPLFIQIAVILTFVAVLATIIAYCVILFRRFQGAKDESRKRFIGPIIDDLILNQVILNPSLAEGVPVNEIQFDFSTVAAKRFRQRWVQQYMVDKIIHFRKNLAGDTGALLSKLYVDLGLEKISMDKLKSPSWHRNVQGLTELMTLGIPIADVTMLPLTNSKIPELRAAARNAYVQLSRNEPFKFFDIATEPLLPWDQLELFKTITTNKHISIPNFSRWVSYSVNPSIISFCMKLIVHYNQQNAIPALIRLLDTKDHVLRAEAINTLGKLAAEEAEDRLVMIYNNQPHNCQIEILKAVGRIGTGRHIEFLKNEFLYSMDYDIRKNAAKSLIRTAGRAPGFMEEIEAVATPDNMLMLKHVSNPLIKS